MAGNASGANSNGNGNGDRESGGKVSCDSVGRIAVACQQTQQEADAIASVVVVFIVAVVIAAAAVVNIVRSDDPFLVARAVSRHSTI